MPRKTAVNPLLTVPDEDLLYSTEGPEHNAYYDMVNRAAELYRRLVVARRSLEMIRDEPTTDPVSHATAMMALDMMDSKI